MGTFSIDHENNITVFASEKQAKAGESNGTEIFTTQEELGKLASTWPGERLVQIWSSLPGVAQVKKFTDRKTAITRIWKAIQSLQPAASEDGHEKPPRRATFAHGPPSRPRLPGRPRLGRKSPLEATGRARAARRPPFWI